MSEELDAIKAENEELRKQLEAIELEKAQQEKAELEAKLGEQKKAEELKKEEELTEKIKTKIAEQYNIKAISKLDDDNGDDKDKPAENMASGDEVQEFADNFRKRHNFTGKSYEDRIKAQAMQGYGK